MRAEYATMMAWKKAQLRAKAREQSAFKARARAIKANRLAYLRYLAAVKARRHAYGRKQAAIRSRRHAQLRAHGQLKAQNRAEAKASAAVKRLARATRIMRAALKVKLDAEKRLRQRTKARVHAERVANHHHRQAVRREHRAKAMYKRRLEAEKRYKLSLAKLLVARNAANKSLKLKLRAEMHAKRSIANDKRIVHRWGVKAVNATRLRVRAQRLAKIAHGKYVIALRLKNKALRQAKHAKVTAAKAHALMVHHRRQARKARRAMRVAYANMKKSEAHRNAMIRYWRKQVTRRNLAAKAAKRAVLLQRRAVKAYKVSVHLRKVAFAKRAAAIKRKAALVKDAKRWAVKAHGAHVRAKKMNILMIAAKKEMIKVRASYKLWVHKLRKAASDAAKKRAQEKVKQLKIQLAHRVRHHRTLLAKEKNLRAIWMKLRRANAVAKRAIVAVVRRTNHWRKVYKTQNDKRRRALRIRNHLINKAKIAARHMRIAIAAQKVANRRRQLAIKRHAKAVAFRNLQVRLRAKYEKMTKMYRHRYNVSIRFGKKQKAIAILHGRMALKHRRTHLAQMKIFKKQTGIRVHAKAMHARFVKKIQHWRRVAHGLKLRVIHYRAVTVRLARERRRVTLKMEDEHRRTMRAKRSIAVQTRLIKVYLRAARRNMIRRRALEASTRRAHLAVIAARKEHRRQVHLKRKMLARYAVLTARNLRNATIRVNRNK